MFQLLQITDKSIIILHAPILILESNIEDSAM